MDIDVGAPSPSDLLRGALATSPDSHARRTKAYVLTAFTAVESEGAPLTVELHKRGVAHLVEHRLGALPGAESTGGRPLLLRRRTVVDRVPHRVIPCGTLPNPLS